MSDCFKINSRSATTISILTFASICFFYFFEAAQIAYYNVLAPSLINHGTYNASQVASLSAAYFYGDMVGLMPVGYALDKFPLRKTLIWAILGSLIGALILFTSEDYYVKWLARFICGLFGGTFSFLGGLRIISLLFSDRFTFYMGLFLGAGMLGGMLCQYPLLELIHRYGPDSAMKAIFILGLAVMAFNFVFLHPKEDNKTTNNENAYQGTLWEMCKEIGFNIRNWCDVLMVVLLDSPISIIGTLWGIVFLTGFFNFSPEVSSWLVMAMFAGLLAGLPVWGRVADKYNNPPWIIILGAGICFLTTLGMFALQTFNTPVTIAGLLFFLGFFSSCQSMGFTWIIKNMHPDLIGRNSAFNSMILMAGNGGTKQIGAIVLGIPALLLGTSSSANLLFLITVAMLAAVIYAAIRKHIFHSLKA